MALDTARVITIWVVHLQDILEVLGHISAEMAPGCSNDGARISCRDMCRKLNACQEVLLTCLIYGL